MGIQADKKKTAQAIRLIFPVIAIIILGFVSYYNSINGQFVWDDENLIKNNVYIRECFNWPKVFTKDIGAGGAQTYNFYRPIQLLSYMFDYSMWQLDPRGYHLSNILLHILAALALFWLVAMLFNDRGIALLTSLLFVVHPIHTEAVAYISGRADLLVSLFLLVCFILYIKAMHTDSWIIYSAVICSYLLALLSRENSLIFPLVLLVYHYAFKQKLKIRLFAPILGLSAAYLILRVVVFKFLLLHQGCPTTVFQRIPGIFVAITNYVRLLLIPINLHAEHGERLFKVIDAKVIIGAMILFCSLMYAFRVRNKDKLVFFSISWFLIMLLPCLNIYPINAYMAEHWLYLPSIGFFLIIAKGISYLYRSRKFKILAIALILGILSWHAYLTIKQNNYWSQPLVFYKRTLRYNPQSARMHHNLGLVYANMNQIKQAITEFNKAIELNPEYTQAYSNLGVMYNYINKTDEAIASFQKAIEIEPGFAIAHNNLALLYFKQKKYELAIEHSDQADGLGFVNPAFLQALENYR